MLALRPSVFSFTLFSPFILSGLFLFCSPLSPRRRCFPPPILRPFPGCVFVHSSPRSTPAPFSLSLPGFTLLRFPSFSSPLSDCLRISALFSHLPLPFSSLFPHLSLLRSLFFRPSDRRLPPRPPSLFPRLFPFSLFPSRPSSLFPLFLLRFTHPFPPRPFSALFPPRTFLFSRPFFSSSALPLFRPPLFARFPARPVDRERLLCYNTFR